MVGWLVLKVSFNTDRPFNTIITNRNKGGLLLRRRRGERGRRGKDVLLRERDGCREWKGRKEGKEGEG